MISESMGSNMMIVGSNSASVVQNSTQPGTTAGIGESSTGVTTQPSSTQTNGAMVTPLSGVGGENTDASPLANTPDVVAGQQIADNSGKNVGQLGNNAKGGSSSDSNVATSSSTSYTIDLLGRKIPVTISGLSADEQKTIHQDLDTAISNVNSHTKDISVADKLIAQKLNGFSVDDSKRTGTDLETGVYNMRSSYILSTSAAWLGSTFFHDADHIVQNLRGDAYNKDTAAGLEGEANAVQLRVGTALGFSDAEKTYLQNDNHTFYNTAPY